MEYEKAKLRTYVEKTAPYMVKLKMYEKFEFERGRLGHLLATAVNSIWIFEVSIQCRADDASRSSTLSKVKFAP